MKDVLEGPKDGRVREVIAGEVTFGSGLEGQGAFHWGRGAEPHLLRGSSGPSASHSSVCRALLTTL